MSVDAGELWRSVTAIVDVPALWEQFWVRPVGVGLLYWRGILAYSVVGLAFYALVAGRGTPRSLSAGVRYIFPASLAAHRSFWIDLKFLLLDVLGIRRQFMVGVSLVLGVTVYAGWLQQLALYSRPGFATLSAAVLGLPTPAQMVIAFVLAMLGGELGFYAIHRASHQVPLLWQFHKVHHYSQQLNPAVITRLHPVDDALQTQVGFLGSLLFTSVVFPSDIDALSFSAQSGGVVAFMLLKSFTSKLTHSHIPVSFGPVLDRIVVSPVMHQMHHSRDIFDTNYGNVLTLWDTIFGTLYRPPRDAPIRFGIREFDDNHYRGILHCTIEPFLEAARLLREGRAFRRPPVPADAIAPTRR
ncbi:MAG: sterol desaturase family protein [Deltaproteobacteria bacterium]|nr:sterol desaturase family protein [Deltaproteobacteria bacterium]